MFKSIEDLVSSAEASGQPLSTVIIHAEAEHGRSTPTDLRQRMQRRLEIMRSSAQQGLESPIISLSGLSGGNAHRFWNWLGDHEPITGSILSRTIARAMAVNELNAGMGCIVATPTAGSAGILPGVLITLQEEYDFSDNQLINVLFTAGGIGAVIVHRAHVSGAEGGCQAETGSAAAMTAGAVVELLGGSPSQSSQAVAITLKNMLGLVCDPVAGLVEIPCVKRNAAGVAQCFVAVDLAMAGVESVIPPDEVIDAMASIGRKMDVRFKETAQGGLAATPTGKRLANLIWNEKQLDTN